MTAQPIDTLKLQVSLDKCCSECADELYIHDVMTSEWDEAKNRANAIKHGIDFETARRIFDAPVLTRRDQRRDYGEERHVSIGRVEEAVIVVAHTTRGANVRLISARPASRAERQAWHGSIR